MTRPKYKQAAALARKMMNGEIGSRVDLLQYDVDVITAAYERCRQHGYRSESDGPAQSNKVTP